MTKFFPDKTFSLTEYDIEKLAPWAQAIEEVMEGFWAFETHDEHETWLNQQ